MIKVKLLNEKARLPVKIHESDAGYDLAACEDVLIPPRSRAVISTGVSLSLPKCSLEGHEYYLRIAPRSGLAAKHGIDVFAGVIDTSYRGECKVCLFNSGDEPFQVRCGDRIAQAILTVFAKSEVVRVDELDVTERGDAGFGSSGSK